MAASMKRQDVLIINCDDTFPLDSVEALVKKSSQAAGIGTCIKQKRFSLPDLKKVSEDVKGEELLCALLVLNAHESRLSINEKNAGIGFAVLYRALLEASEGRTIVVIGGDEDSSSADKKIVSNRIRYKVASQFEDEYFDGRRGFVFSWGKNSYPVHKEAFVQYLRAITNGKDGLEKAFDPTTHSKTNDPEKTQEESSEKESARSDCKNNLKKEELNDEEDHTATNSPDDELQDTEKSDNACMSELSKNASTVSPKDNDKESKNTSQDKSTGKENPRPLPPRPVDTQEPLNPIMDHFCASEQPQASPNTGMSQQPKHHASSVSFMRNNKIRPLPEIPVPATQAPPESGERHRKHPAPDDGERQQIVHRLNKRVEEFTQSHPERQAKVCAVLRYGKLDERYIFNVDKQDDTFTVPEYMKKGFLKKRNTPEADVIIFKDNEYDGNLSSTSWEVSSGWKCFSSFLS